MQSQNIVFSFIKTPPRYERTAWMGAAIAAAFIAPIGALRGIAQIFSGEISKGYKTVFYSSVIGLHVTFVSATSIFMPTFGNKITHKGLIDTDDLYKKPRNGFEKLDFEKYPEEKFKIATLIVATDKGNLDAVEVSPTGVETDNFIIKFCGSGHNYQEAAKSIVDAALSYNCHVITANYPGVSVNDYKAVSQYDYTNIGIALLNDLMKRKNWTADQLTQHVILDGYSMGGLVAISVAYHLKKNYSLDIPVFLDRSPSSIALCVAATYNHIAQVPVWFGEKLVNLYCYAAGDFNFDATPQFTLLNHNKVDFINAKNDSTVPDGFGFSDIAGNKNDHYFEYVSHLNSDKPVETINIHKAPRQSLYQSDKKINSRDYFGLFAKRMWEQDNKLDYTSQNSIKNK